MKKIFIILFIIFTVPTFAFIILHNNSQKKSENIIQKNGETTTPYDFVYPKKITQTKEITWKFISNDFVSVYNRRSGIIQDIFVDIWDEVKSGQVLATLFEVGVDWESSSFINEKLTLLKAKENELQNAKHIQEQKINEWIEKIKEQYVLLEQAKENQKVKINQITNLQKNTSFLEENSVNIKKQAIEIEQKALQLLEQNLEDAILSKNSKLEELEEKKKQILQNSFIVIQKSFDEILKLLYLWENRVISENTFINNNDISLYLSAKDTNLRNTFLEKIQDFYIKKQSSWDIQELFEKLEEIYALAPNIIENTVLSANITQDQLDNFKTSIFSENNLLITQRSNLENIIKMYETTSQTENEKINTIQNNILKQKEIISLKEKEQQLSIQNQEKTNKNIDDELEKIITLETWNIESIEAKIWVLEKNLELIKSQEQKNIDDIQNSLNIIKSSLQTTTSIYWNNEIISPFDGIISKRNINVGDMIATSSLAFEMVWVETNLSKKSPQEVVFSIPEEMKDSIKNWDEIEFIWVEKSSNTFTWSIWRISPQVDTINNTIQIQARVEKNFLPHNSNVRVFLKNEKKYFRVPFQSIYNKNWEKVIYFLKDSWNLWYRKINIIHEIWEMVDIEWSHIDENYKIVTTPLYFDN